ncbi:hypothetical protein TNCV_967621 [Trichonephila clavipes]|nr:hypothetical protein TNCV_967621 [Trichonephila clavipes]
MLVTEHFSSVSTPILRKNTLRVGQGTLSNLTRRLAAQRIFRVPPCNEGTVHLLTHVPSKGFDQRPYHTAVSITSHHIGWAVGKLQSSPSIE